ncbi:MAG TPA: hypothetical protein VLA00_05840 [Xanthobacteraceae bacterium]|nr:hypothetical protein [Xanthobacteraceae bacterium]
MDIDALAGRLHFPAHNIRLRAGILVGENFAGLGAVPRAIAIAPAASPDGF